MFFRLHRIYRESGTTGLLLRLPFRAIISISEHLTLSMRLAFGKIPLRWLTPRSVRSRLSNNEHLRNRHAGARCFILGNGPSLAKEDVEKLQGEILFTCNQGYLFSEKSQLEATYHAFVDAIYLRPEYSGFLDDMIQLRETKKVSLITSTQIADALRARQAGIELYEIHQFLISDYAKLPDKQLPDLTTAQLGFLSVIHVAISAAIFMGFKEIFLLGCDMDFFVDPSQRFEHSYGRGRFGESDKTAAELFGWNQVELMEWCLREFRGFNALRLVAESHDISIVNAGQGGALNIFPRKALADILGGSKAGG